MLDIIQSMMEKVVIIDQGEYSQDVKDESKRIMNYTLDFVLEQTKESTINALVLDEYRKKQ